MKIVAFDPDHITKQDRDSIVAAARAAGALVEFGATEGGKEFAIVWCAKWTSFGVMKDGRAWHAYNEKGEGVSLEGSPGDLVRRLTGI